MSNEIFEFALALSAAAYRSGLAEAKGYTSDFRGDTKSKLGLVNSYFSETADKVKIFADHYKTQLGLAGIANENFAMKSAVAIGATGDAFDTIGKAIEKRLASMTGSMMGYSTAMSELGLTSEMEIKGLAQQMLTSAVDTTEYTNSLKSLNATARGTAGALTSLATAQGKVNASQAGAAGVGGNAPAGSGIPAIPTVAKQAAGAATDAFGVLKDKIKEAEDGAKAFKERLSDIASGSRAVATAATISLATIGGAIVQIGKGYGDLESSINRIKALSAPTMKASEDIRTLTEDMIRFKEFALSTGEATAFSAQAIGKAGVELTKMGYDVQQSMQMLPSIIHAATIEQVDLAEASKLVSNVLKGFGKEAGDASHIMDVLSKASAMSSIDLRDLGETFKYVASIAHASGQSIENISALITIMGDAGIKASQAGTSLRQALVSLQRPTKAAQEVLTTLDIDPKDHTTGKLKDLSEILKELQKSFVGVDSTAKNAATSAIFGQYALSGMLAILNQSPEKIDKAVAAMHDLDGVSKQIAEDSFQGLNAEFAKLTASVDTLKVRLGEQMAPQLTEFIQQIKELINTVSHLPPEILTMIGSFLIFTAKLSALALVISGTVAGVTMLGRGILSLIGIQNAAAIAMAANTFAANAGIISMNEYAVAANGAAIANSLMGNSATAASGTMNAAIASTITKLGLLGLAIAAAKTTWDSFQAQADAQRQDEDVTKNNLDQNKEFEVLTKVRKKLAEQSPAESGVNAGSTDIFGNVASGRSKNPMDLLRTGGITPQELETSAAAMRNLASGKSGKEASELNAQAMAWMNIAKNYRTAKSGLDDLVKSMEDYRTIRNALNEPNLNPRSKQLDEESLAAKEKQINDLVSKARQNGFTDVKTLAQMEEYWDKMKTRSDEIAAAAARGSHGPGTDKYLQQLDKEADLLKRKHDQTLTNLDLDTKLINITNELTSATKNYNSEQDLMNQIAGRKVGFGRGEAGTGAGAHTYLAARDLQMDAGSKFYSPAAGRVIFTGMSGTDGVPGRSKGTGYGNLMKIDFGNGVVGNFGHLTQFGVKPGQIVKPGDLLGLSGGALGAHGAGNSSGDHLHVDFTINGANATHMNAAVALLHGISGREVKSTIDPNRLAERNQAIEGLITEQEAMKAKFIAGGYQNEAEKVGQFITQLRAKMVEGQDKYNEQMGKAEEDRATARAQNDQQMVQGMEQFKEQWRQTNIDMAKSVSQEFMTPYEKNVDDAMRVVAEAERKIGLLREKIDGTDLSESVRTLMKTELDDRQKDLAAFVDSYGASLSQVKDKAGELKEIFEQIQSYQDLKNKAQTEGTQYVTSRLVGALKQQAAKLKFQADGKKGLPGMGAMVGMPEQDFGIDPAVVKKFTDNIDKYTKKMMDLNKQRGQLNQNDEDIKDLKRIQDRTQTIYESHEALLKQKEELNKKGPQSYENDLGFFGGVQGVSPSEMKGYLEQHIKDQLQNLEVLKQQNIADLQGEGYLKRKAEIDKDIKKTAGDILHINTGITDEVYKQTVEMLTLKGHADDVSKVSGALSQIFSSASKISSSFGSGKANSEASQFFGVLANGASAVTSIAAAVGSGGLDVSADIQAITAVVSTIGDITQLFPDTEKIRKEAAQFRDATISASIESDKAILEARRLAGEEGTDSYYDAMRSLQDKEHQKNMNQIEEQTQEEIHATIGFWDYVLNGLLNKTGPGMQVTSETAQKVQNILSIAQQQKDAEEQDNANKQKELSLQKTQDDAAKLGRINALRTGIAVSKAKTSKDTLGGIDAELQGNFAQTFGKINDITAKMLSENRTKMTDEEQATYDSLLTAYAGYQDDAKQKRKDYYKGLSDMANENAEKQAGLEQDSYKKSTQLEQLQTDREMQANKDRMQDLVLTGQKEGQEYQLLATQQELILQEHYKRQAKIDREYAQSKLEIIQDLNASMAALTADQFDDLEAQENEAVLDLNKWRDDLVEQFPELTDTIDKTFNNKLIGIGQDTADKASQIQGTLRQEYRDMLMSQAEASADAADDMVQSYANSLAEINDTEALAMHNHQLTEDQKTTATKKAAAERLKAEKAFKDGVLKQELEQLDYIGKVRKAMFDEQTLQQQTGLDDLQHDLDVIGLKVREDQQKIQEAQNALDKKKADYNKVTSKEDIDAFVAGQMNQDVDGAIKKALAFNQVNITNTTTEAAARKLQDESMDAYVEFLKQNVETDRTLKLIDDTEREKRLQQITFMQGAFEQGQITKVNTFYDTEIDKMKKAGASVEELDITNDKRDKEISDIKKKYSEAFDQYHQLALDNMDDEMKKADEQLYNQLETDQQSQASTQNKYDAAKNSLDEYQIVYDNDMRKITLATQQVNDAQTTLDTSFAATKALLEGGVASAVDTVKQRYDALLASSTSIQANAQNDLGPALDGLATKYQSIADKAAAAAAAMTQAAQTPTPSSSSSGGSSSGSSGGSSGGFYAGYDSGPSQSQMDTWSNQAYEDAKSAAATAISTAGVSNFFRFKTGGITPIIPGFSGVDRIPTLLSGGEEINNFDQRKGIFDYISKIPGAVAGALIRQNSNQNTLQMFNTINDRTDADYVIQMVKQFYDEKSLTSSNTFGHLVR